jgi:3-methyladenine DNA glycosylase AlkD
MTGVPELARAVRAALAAHADPLQAGPMQAYMKSALPFHGVPAPLRRKLVKAAAAPYGVAAFSDAGALCTTVLTLWRDATHREQRYAALDLLRLPRARQQLNLQCLPMLHELIETGPWWDHNDELSGVALAVVLERHPDVLKPLLRQWATGPNLWFRRAAMLCQRSLDAAHFDAPLLYDCIRPSLAPDPLAGEFFVRKGMGWALRERSHDAPDEVQAFCDEHRKRLSPLTLREALKGIEKRRSTRS